jgi:hypothetical protein
MQNLDFKNDMKVEEGLLGKMKRPSGRGEGKQERVQRNGGQYDQSTLCTRMKMSE